MKFSLLCTTVCALSFILPVPSAFAQSLPPLPIQLIPDNIQNPGRPGGRRRGGGSRGECLANNVPLSAIAYADSQTVSELGIERTEETVGMLTTKARPVLWFYLPSELSNDTETAFVLKDAQEQVLYQGQLLGETDEDGIIGVPLAADLEIDATYHWFLTLDCGDGEQTMVDGWIARKRVSAELKKRFEPVGDRNRAALYANYGFLQDALTELARLKLEQPEDEATDQDWVNFLNALDLSDLAAARPLDCCLITIQQPTTETPAVPEVEDSITPETEIPEAEIPETEVPESTVPEEETRTEPQDVRTILQRARDKG